MQPEIQPQLHTINLLQDILADTMFLRRKVLLVADALDASLGMRKKSTTAKELRDLERRMYEAVFCEISSIVATYAENALITGTRTETATNVPAPIVSLDVAFASVLTADELARLRDLVGRYVEQVGNVRRMVTITQRCTSTNVGSGPDYTADETDTFHVDGPAVDIGNLLANVSVDAKAKGESK